MGGFEARVWKKENSFSSKDETTIVELLGLPPDAKQMCGEYICIDELDAAGNKVICPPARKEEDAAEPGTPCFAQNVGYYYLDSFIRFLDEKLGINMRFYKRVDFPISVHINVKDFDNAMYFPPDKDLTFGVVKYVEKGVVKEFPLILDGDIVIHELFHWVIDPINPMLTGGFLSAGAAIQEGCADLVAVMYHSAIYHTDDWQVGESYSRHKRGIRTVHNNETFQGVYSKKSFFFDPHEIGKIYSGSGMSLFEAIEKLLRKKAGKQTCAPINELAHYAIMKIILAHASAYNVPNPDHGDFPDAVVAGTKELIDAGVTRELTDWGITLADIEPEIRRIAKERGFDWIAAPVSVPPPPALVGEPVTINLVYGGETLFYPQLYKTARLGDAVVLGHGYMNRQIESSKVEDYTQNIRIIKPGSIKEDVKISKEEAFNLAVKAIQKELPEMLARRTGMAAVPLVSRVKIVNDALSFLNEKGGGKLAVLPDSTDLVWIFDAGMVEIAINAFTGKTAAPLGIRGMID